MDDRQKNFGSGDDWFVEEKKRESRISARDLDGTKNLRKRRESARNRQKDNDTSDPFFVLDLILFSLMIPFSLLISQHSLIPMTAMFLFLVTGGIVWESVFKKFPPQWYFILALILTVILEALAIQGVI